MNTFSGAGQSAKWYFDCEHAAFSQGTLHLDCAAVRSHDPMHQVQAQPCARLALGIAAPYIFLEQARQLVLRNTLALVSYLDCQ